MAAGTPLTVTFHSQGGSGATPLDGLTYGAKSRKPQTNPEREDYAFRGWYKEAGETREWKFDADTVTENTILYAKWKKVNFKVSGTVCGYQSATEIAGTTVVLMKGSEKIDESATGADGAVAFSKHIPAGAYNVVTTYTPQGKDQQIKTTLVPITDADAEVDVNLPPEGVNSSLTVKEDSGTPAVVVRGLDKEAEKLFQEAYVKKVTIAMEVESKTEAAATGSAQIKAEAKKDIMPPPRARLRPWSRSFWTSPFTQSSDTLSGSYSTYVLSH